MRTVRAETVADSFSSDRDPVVFVGQDERFQVETTSLLTGGMFAKGDFEAASIPLTGPIAIEGVGAGETLRVDIHDIEIADRGAMATLPGRGGFRDPLARSGRVLDIRDGHVIFDDSVHLPISPMIGKIGVGVPGVELGSSDVGDQGGNLDCKDLTSGSSIYLPLSSPQGLLYLGDLHALQGDGESSLTGVEVEGTITLSCRTVAAGELKRPIIVSGDRAFCIATGTTLEEAVQTALEDVIQLIGPHKGWDRETSAMFVSVAADVGICQVVNPHVSVKVSLKREHLGSPFSD